MSLAVRSIQIAVRLLGLIAPAAAARWIYRLWLRPFRFSEPATEVEIRRSSTPVQFPHRDIRLIGDSWGSGPLVMLVHGWNGRGALLASFVPGLLQAGFRVVSFDAPAHGRSPGRSTNMPEIGEAIRNVAGSCGPIRAIVAHSLGVPSALIALDQGLAIERFVAVSPPGDVFWMVDSFFETLQVPSAVRPPFIRCFEDQFGSQLWDRYSLHRIAAKMNLPALIVHDDDDRDVPIAQGRKLASVWRGAEFMGTKGLGHRRILRDPSVVNRVLSFLSP